ncbi:MAG TPA: TonB family protein [Candidatus Acidoferrales bacterium]|nr:TonB family protein [Candidatus Acidoferrales bacterium]
MATATAIPPASAHPARHTPTAKEHFFGWVPRKEDHSVTRLPAPVRAANSYTDFSDAFLSPNLLGSPSHKRTLATSIAVHVSLLVVILSLSLWFTNTLDLRTYTVTLLVAPPPPSAPSPPPKVAAAAQAAQSRRVLMVKGKLFMPTAIPKQVAMLKEAPLPPETDAEGVFGGVPGGVTGGVLGGILEGIRPPEPPAAPRAEAAEKPRGPVPVGGNVQPPRILYQTNPEYPLLARQAGIQGEVIVSAVIDSSGKVVDMKVVSGPPLLYDAAMKALANWKFEPTYLNGEPVPIKWNVSVHFRIASSREAS